MRMSDEIPVTPEMIEAGREAHARMSDPSIEEMWTLRDEVLSAMYRAMRALDPIDDYVAWCLQEDLDIQNDPS